LPPTEQISIANSILENLTIAGELPMSDEVREELQRRAAAFEADSGSGQPWEDVRKEVFGEE
jgi:putative addiction module component (TIGR02574 family)